MFEINLNIFYDPKFKVIFYYLWTIFKRFKGQGGLTFFPQARTRASNNLVKNLYGIRGGLGRRKLRSSFSLKKYTIQPTMIKIH